MREKNNYTLWLDVLKENVGKYITNTHINDRAKLERLTGIRCALYGATNCDNYSPLNAFYGELDDIMHELQKKIHDSETVV